MIIGVLIGKSDIIYKHFFGKNQEKFEKVIPNPLKKSVPEFNAEIVGKKSIYIRGTNSIVFRSKYKGKLKNGYFVNEISVPNVSPQHQYMYLFTPETQNVSEDLKSVKSYCSNTIDNSSNNIGKLNGYNDIDWTSWEWKIPNDSTLGKHSIKMMVFNGGKGEQPLQTIEEEITIGIYMQKVNFQ